jgi:hypothetical protein
MASIYTCFGNVHTDLENFELQNNVIELMYPLSCSLCIDFARLHCVLFFKNVISSIGRSSIVLEIKLMQRGIELEDVNRTGLLGLSPTVNCDVSDVEPWGCVTSAQQHETRTSLHLVPLSELVEWDSVI